MGSLKPDATYVYEKADGVTYAREAGSAPSTRKEIGRDYDLRITSEHTLHDRMMKSKLWDNIHRAAETNPALQKALEQCIIIYHLNNPSKNPIQHHPV